MSLQATTTRNTITLAGSAKIVAEFFAYAVNRCECGGGWPARWELGVVDIKRLRAERRLAVKKRALPRLPRSARSTRHDAAR